MSLVQFLQQSLLKDVSHSTLQQIQQQYTATQSLLDTMSYLRQKQKLSILEQNINQIQLYLKTRENIFKCFKFKGFDKQQFQLWINSMFNNQNLVKEMIRIEKNKIEKIIVQAVCRNFGVGGVAEEFQGSQELIVINQGLMKMNVLRQCQINNKSPTRQEVMQASKMYEKFKVFQAKFHTNIQKFNLAIQNYIKQLKKYQLKVRQQFLKLLQFQQTPSERDSPFKKLQYAKDQDVQSTSENIQIDPMMTNAYFYRQNQRPLRHAYYYDTF